MTEQDQRLEAAGKPVALVTGAARGIGRAIANALSRHRYDIAGVDIAWQEGAGTSSAPELEAEIGKNGGRLLALHGDIADLKAHGRLVDSTLEHLGRIDLLVNNAGVAPLQRGDMLEMRVESFDRVQAVNLRGAFFLTQRVAKWMISAGATIPAFRPRIIFITSISAAATSVDRAEYCISKSGLSMAAQLYADRLSKAGIPVFEIRPGLILTDMTVPAKEKYDGLIREGLVPQRRWGTPEDVASAVASLAGGPFDYSTGAVIEVSGGMNIRSL